MARHKGTHGPSGSGLPCPQCRRAPCECLEVEVVHLVHGDEADFPDDFEDYRLEWGLWPPIGDEIDCEPE